MLQPVSRVVDLTDPALNRIFNMTVDEARARVLRGTPDSVREIDGSFALVARDGKTVRLARSLDRPMRYFLAKRAEGPALIVADRIDAIHNGSQPEGFGDQFHPSYTRMVPAHHVTEIATHRLSRSRSRLHALLRLRSATRSPTDLDEIGRRVRRRAGGRDREVARSHRRRREPIGVCFSGGIDSGAVFLVDVSRAAKLGDSPSRLKAFTLELSATARPGAGARVPRTRSGLGCSSNRSKPTCRSIDCAAKRFACVEDYKPLDVEAASMGLRSCRGIRSRYPDWKHLARRRRRRRESQGLPDRGKPRADHPQRGQQLDALPGRLGRRDASSTR